MGKTKKLFSLSDEDVELLKALQGELETTGIAATQSDIVTLGLRLIEKEGGSLKAMQKSQKKTGTDEG